MILKEIDDKMWQTLNTSRKISYVEYEMFSIGRILHMVRN
jgi:hypothetical protein